MTELFGEPISVYSRAQAIEDGFLVDVTAWAGDGPDGMQYYYESGGSTGWSVLRKTAKEIPGGCEDDKRDIAAVWAHDFAARLAESKGVPVVITVPFNIEEARLRQRLRRSRVQGEGVAR